MNKIDLINAAAKRTCCRKEAKDAVEELLKTIKEALRQNKKVHLTGIGTLYTKLRHKRIFKNPKTGSKIEVPEKQVVKFKSSSCK